MNKELIVASLREISTLEPNRFKSLAYLRACRELDLMSDEDFNSRTTFLDLPGIGMSINTKLLDFKKNGTIPAKLYKLREENKSYLDPHLYKVRKGFITKRIPYTEALKIWEGILLDLSIKVPKFQGINDHIYLLGSMRRKKALIADFDVLVDSEELYVELVNMFIKVLHLDVLVQGPMKTSFKLSNQENTQIDISWCSLECLPYSILHFTGSVASNIRLRALAKEQGYTLNQYGLYKNDISELGNNRIGVIKTEEDIFTFLGISYVEPQNR